MWRRLAEVYAIRAREFSDAVAHLGQHDQFGPEVFELLKEVKRLRGLCDAAAAELDRYLVIEKNPPG